jgi:hypothetical protein
MRKELALAIEGPLREMGIHDVFQLLDLSRKTGVLEVSSDLRENSGVVHLKEGSVVFAELKSNPHRLGELLVAGGRITQDEFDEARRRQSDGDARKIGAVLVGIGAIVASDIDRQVREQVEEVVFEMLGWSEGRFSFEEGDLPDHPWDATVRITTDTLLLDGARRIEEWSRIRSKVPDGSVVPRFAPTALKDETRLDLLPGEWEVLAEVDGRKETSAIARTVARSTFEVARIMVGLEGAGLIDFDEAEDPGEDYVATDIDTIIRRVEEVAASDGPDRALALATDAIEEHPDDAVLFLVRGRLQRDMKNDIEAESDFRNALRKDPLLGPAHRELGEALSSQGKHSESLKWLERWLATSSFTAVEPDEVEWVEKTVMSARNKNTIKRDNS